MPGLLYNSPASVWEEALPLGNGRMGAMVYGGAVNEHIQLNEESIWYGGKMDRDNPDTLNNLPKIRKLLLDGEISKAERLMRLTMSGCPESAHPYQTLGDLYIDFNIEGDICNYERELDLEKAVAGVKFSCAGVNYTRTVFASQPADCIVMCIESDRPGTISLEARFSRPERAYNGVDRIGKDTIVLHGDLGKHGYDFAVSLKAAADGGSVEQLGEYLVVTDADRVVLYIAADCTYHCKDELEHIMAEKLKTLKESGTAGDLNDNTGSYAVMESKAALGLLKGRMQKVLVRAADESYNRLLDAHISDYRRLFARVDFSLEGDEDNCDAVKDSASGSAAYTTDELLKSAKEGSVKDELFKLYFDFGRYLLISCSREGGLPATLQGLWNKDMLPPWDCKYTININTEMNYWLAENCNLSECHEPLFSLIKKMLPNGQRTAKTMYGCRGFVAHHNTNIEGETSVQDLWIPGSYWVMGAAWLCTHQWTHYLYTGDKEFLRENFNIMREAAQFFLDFMIEVDGYLMTCPSVSPENSYVLPNGEKGANGAGVTMDNQIIRDLFTQCIKAADILGVDDELNSQIKDALSRLLPTRIGSDGRILEWREDYKEYEPGHRHISHLYGLHPSSQITMDGTPQLAEAARRTLEGRLSHGGGHTGWSRAWIINHYAKLWDGEAAYDNLCKLFTSSTYPNLFDMHPPFQIDGNFGATAAIAEMIVQSNEERIVLLPALPKEWKNGHLYGVRVVGNASVDISWENGDVKSAVLHAYSDINKVLRLPFGEHKGEWNIICRAGESVELLH
ncbi:MAG TPA: alpha-L-fucosidase [Eubacterium sp.]|nr:alpha-L-fucosidase [Eubacterium sp.]HAZ86731.1 alpha-L-fucosidase [Eubacterium sp.]